MKVENGTVREGCRLRSGDGFEDLVGDVRWIEFRSFDGERSSGGGRGRRRRQGWWGRKETSTAFDNPREEDDEEEGSDERVGRHHESWREGRSRVSVLLEIVNRMKYCSLTCVGRQEVEQIRSNELKHQGDELPEDASQERVSSSLRERKRRDSQEHDRDASEKKGERNRNRTHSSRQHSAEQSQPKQSKSPCTSPTSLGLPVGSEEFKRREEDERSLLLFDSSVDAFGWSWRSDVGEEDRREEGGADEETESDFER